MCHVHTDGDIVTVRPAGQLTHHTVAGLRSVLNKAVAEGPAAIIINLADVVVRDHSCLTLFPAVAKHAAAESQASVLLCAASDTLAEPLRAMSVDNAVPLYSTLREARTLAVRQPVARTELRLAPDQDAPAFARSFVDQTCGQWRVPGEVTEALRLISTELVSNVILHAGTPMQLILRRSRRYIHVAVIDEEPRPAVLRRPESPQSPSGRGLMFVDAFSAAWGCTPTASGGKSTWATLAHRAPAA
jgi:anti-anti-sigma factor